MIEPSDKHPQLDAFIKDVTGKDRKATIRGSRCMLCNGDASVFRNEISKREYAISGLCQKCQDETFGVD